MTCFRFVPIRFGSVRTATPPRPDLWSNLRASLVSSFVPLPDGWVAESNVKVALLGPRLARPSAPPPLRRALYFGFVSSRGRCHGAIPAARLAAPTARRNAEEVAEEARSWAWLRIPPAGPLPCSLSDLGSNKRRRSSKKGVFLTTSSDVDVEKIRFPSSSAQ